MFGVHKRNMFLLHPKTYDIIELTKWIMNKVPFSESSASQICSKSYCIGI